MPFGVGIRVTRYRFGPGGGIRLWLIADDNFRSSQRTLLLRFEVLP